MIKKIRYILWRILGFRYQMLFNKTDFLLLKDDIHTKKGLKTYDNGAKVWRWTEAPLIIGNFCSIAHNVNFIVDQGYHQVSQITNYPFVNNLTTQENLLDIKNNVIQKMGISIGNDVWIGLNVIILPGVKVGNGVTIAANAVVTKDIPDYSVVSGSPAKIIKMKFDNVIIMKMNKIAWWNWPLEIINDRTQDFYLLNIEEFIEKYKDYNNF